MTTPEALVSEWTSWRVEDDGRPTAHTSSRLRDAHGERSAAVEMFAEDRQTGEEDQSKSKTSSDRLGEDGLPQDLAQGGHEETVDR